MDFLDKIRYNHLVEFLNDYKKIAKFNFESYLDETKLLLNYYQKGTSSESGKLFIHDIEKKWYKSLKEGDPDYTVYDHPKFVIDLWACWKIYSRAYIKNIKDPKVFDYIKSKGINHIVDIGCGLGYSTVALKQLFDCKVSATNSQNSFQYKYCKHLFKPFHIKIAPDVSSFKKCDLVFASEYFEHFEAPIKHLLYILENTKPKFIIFANAFGSKAIGHFNIYLINGIKIENKKVGRLFNKILKEKGYIRMETGFYNNRPYIFEKIKNNSKQLQLF